MADKLPKSSRKLLLLRWIKALNEGYGSHNGREQPATSSNLAAFMLDNNAYWDAYERNFSRSDLRKPYSDDAVNRLQTELRNTLRQSYGHAHIGFHRIKKREENHVFMRRGRDKRNTEIRAYTITKKGEERIEYLEEDFERTWRAAQNVDGRVTSQTITYPVKERSSWRLKEKTIPNVVNGECIDTGVKVY